MQHWGRWRMRIAGALAGTSALLFLSGLAASASSAPAAASLSITKDCAGLSGTVTLSLSVTIGDTQPLSDTVPIDCGQTKTITGIPNGDGSLSLVAGYIVTISERGRDVLAVLPAPSQTITLAAGTNSVTIVDPPAVSIKKTCASGVTGTATFSVTDATEEATLAVRVPCGTTVPVPLPATWDTDEDLVIHETTPPTNGVAAADVTVTIPSDNGTPQVATFNNAAVAASATASATPRPTPTPRTLAFTGAGRGASPWPAVLLVAMASALLLLGGVHLRRRGEG